MRAPLYTLGPDGKPNETSAAGTPSASHGPESPQPVQLQPNVSPHRIQKPSQRNGSLIVPEAVERGLRHEAEHNRPGPQEASNASEQEDTSNTSHELPRSNPLEQAFPYGIGAQSSGLEESDGGEMHSGTNGTQEPRVPLRLGMMGVGGYMAGKDEMGWSGQWPNLYEQPRQERNASTSIPNPTNGCCSSKTVVNESPPAAQSIGSSDPREPSDGLSLTSTHGVNAVSCPSCQTRFFENQPTRQHYSQIPVNGPQMAPKYPPLLLYQHPAALHPHHMDMSQTTLYTIPPSYATASHPLTLQQLAFLQQNPHLYSQTVPQYAPFGIVGQVAPPADEMITFAPAHNCNCGAACQCLGCAAHPFNTTTRSHVQSLGAIIAHGDDDRVSGSPPQSGCGPLLNQPLDIHNVMPVTSQCFNGNLVTNPSSSEVNTMQTATPSFSQSTWSPTGSNGPDGQQVPFLSSAYYTMEIPMDSSGPKASCTDVSGSCQCGDECACIGCLTHSGHNGIPLNI
ncbi:MAG: hypothetical protein M1830_002575 [Pleopsidium flavum]|nr:MAG: hypothetical protein M1830_002575 [Pleopsidium flavum]